MSLCKGDLDSMTFRGFQSFGDYETTVNIGSLGPCLIVGCIDGDITRSNGSGKSAFNNAMLWGRFGRTMHSHVPGDRIINTHCDLVSVTMRYKSGLETVRTRQRGGETELSIDGKVYGTTAIQQKKLDQLLECDWRKFTSSAFITQMHKPWLSMPAPTRRKEFERLFKLDVINEIAASGKNRIVAYDASINSNISATAKLNEDIAALMESIASLEAKSAEHIQNVAVRAQELREEAVAHRAEYEAAITIDIEKLKVKWDVFKQAQNVVEQIKQRRDQINGEITAAQSIINEKQRVVAKNERVQIVDIDLNDLKAKWDFYNSALAELEPLNKELAKYDIKIALAKRELKEKQTRLKELNDVETTCLRCGQPISQEQAQKEAVELASEIEAHSATTYELECYADNIRQNQLKAMTERIESLLPERTLAEANLIITNNQRIKTELAEAHQALKDANQSLVDLQEKLAAASDKYTKASELLEKNKPQYTEKEAKALNDSKQMCLRLAEKAEADADAEEKKANPYKAIIESERNKIEVKRLEIAELESVLIELRDDSRHMAFIRKNYNDKDKIKADLVARLVSEFNSYLNHYTDLFDSEVAVAIDSALNISTTCEQDYEFCSGGERQRVDLGVDLSTFLTYVSLYGKYSNIMVLDEVDSRMDASGVQALVTAVNDDLSTRFDTVMVVSHMQRMRDSFSSRIVVNKINGFSHITVEN